ncbi:hypothetical protein VTO42DRAFT_6876 [Malbranchea cinnamomea]
MKFSALALFSTLAAVVSAVTPPDYSKGPEGNPIFTPGLDEQVPVGEPYTITWDPTTEGKISIQLLRGPATNLVTIDTLADSIDNTGSFVWTPSENLEPDTSRYALILIVEGTGQFQWSTQFGIKNDNYVAPPSEPSTTSAVVPPVVTPSAVAPPVVTTVPIRTITTTICAVSTPTLPSGIAQPTGSTTYRPTPTPTPGLPTPPPFEGAAGRNTVGLVGSAVVALAALLAF